MRYEPIAVQIADQRLLGAYYGWLCHCQWWFGDYGPSIQTATQAARLCEAGEDIAGVGRAYQSLAWNYLETGDYEQALAWKERTMRAFERRFDLRWYVYAHTGASLALSWCGRWDSAVAEGQKGLRVAEEFADNSTISFAAWTIAWAYISKNDLRRAVEYGELSVQRAPLPADKAWAQCVLAWAWSRGGEPLKAVEPLTQIITMCRAAHFLGGEIFTPFLGEAYWLAGEYDKATQVLEELLEIVEPRGMTFLIGAAHRLLGEVARCTNPAQSAPHFEHSIAILRAINAENELALAYAGYGRLHRQQGHITPAREYLTQALAIFERLGTLGEPDRVRQVLAELPEG